MGELLSHACHLAQRARDFLRWCSDDLTGACSEFDRTVADLHARQV